FSRDWSSDVCSSDLYDQEIGYPFQVFRELKGDSTYVTGLELIHGPGDAPGLRITSQKDGQLLSRWNIGGEGYLSYVDLKNNSPRSEERRVGEGRQHR